MSITIGQGIGLGVTIGQFELSLYIGDVHLKMPRLFEFSWNQTGAHLNRL